MISNTLVRNGTPFIDLVLRQAEPFMSQMIITVSEKSQDGTMDLVRRFQNDFSEKVIILTENVSEPSWLTTERQRQVDLVPKGEIVLFLDDDDFWPTESLKDLVKLDFEDADAYCFAPYQMIDKDTFDLSWKNKWFTKLFKNDDINYRHPWPRDLIYKGNDVLYWKKNQRVKKTPIKFFHLSYLKKYSFRNEAWATEYGMNIGRMAYLPEYEIKNINKIYEYVRSDK